MPSIAAICVPLRLVGEQICVWVEASPRGSSLPVRELGESESEEFAQTALLSDRPFARDVVRRACCGVRSAPRRRKDRREIALVAWAIVRGNAPRPGEARRPPDPNWRPIDEAAGLVDLIDDHAEVVAQALGALRDEVLGDPVTRRVLPRHLLRSRSDACCASGDPAAHVPALFGLLPDPFPLSAIRRFYERLFAAEIDRGNFRRKLVELKPTGILKELPIFQRGVRHRAAQLFTFDPRAWERWIAAGDGAAGEGDAPAPGRDADQ